MNLGGVPALTAMAEVLAQRRIRSRAGVLAGRPPLTAHGRLRYPSVMAELAVASELHGLGPEWAVLHDLPVEEGGALAHLLVGPAGIYALHDVAEPATAIAAAGAARKAGRVARALSSATGTVVAVKPVVVEPGARRYPHTLADHPAALVMTADAVGPWVADRPRELQRPRAQALVAAALRPATWAGVSAAAEPGFVLASFQRLTADIRTAALRRILNIALAVAVGAALILIAVVALASAA